MRMILSDTAIIKQTTKSSDVGAFKADEKGMFFRGEGGEHVQFILRQLNQNYQASRIGHQYTHLRNSYFTSITTTNYTLRLGGDEIQAPGKEKRR